MVRAKAETESNGRRGLEKRHTAYQRKLIRALAAITPTERQAAMNLVGAVLTAVDDWRDEDPETRGLSPEQRREVIGGVWQVVESVNWEPGVEDTWGFNRVTLSDAIEEMLRRDYFEWETSGQETAAE